MPKNIVLCLDGTWNGLEITATKQPSNVWHLFDSLAGEEAPRKMELGRVAEVEKKCDGQVAKYIHGIGDEPTPLQYIEGAIGGGIINRIAHGYSYIAGQYEKGDKIYICGFSRGATEARAIADLIASMGLLKRTDDETEDSFWWRCELLFDKSLRKLPGNEKKSYPVRFLQDFRFPQRVNQDPESFKNASPKSKAILESYQFQETPETLDSDVEVEAVAVWDTVEALTPLERAENNTLNILTDECHQKIRNGFHAISVDENRTAFSPSLWNCRKEGVIQCLFPGAHSDVGGGYPSDESGLSNNALHWMLSRLPGELFKDLNEVKSKFKGDSVAMSHLSDSFILSRDLRDFSKRQGDLRVHQSILDRWDTEVTVKLDSGDKTPAQPYRPKQLASHVLAGKPLPGVEVEPYGLSEEALLA